MNTFLLTSGCKLNFYTDYMSAPQVNGLRLMERIMALAEISPIPGGGNCRLALTDEDKLGRDLVITWMIDLGLHVSIDTIGNIVGTWKVGSGAPVMTGSHIDTQIGSAGSTSASRQTWMSGGAVDGACRLVREQIFLHVGAQYSIDPLRLVIEGTDVIDQIGTLRVAVCEAVVGLSLSETFEHHHKPTEELDENGQGNCHTAFAFVAHRAVVDVDPELGLVKVVQIATAQDVGRVLNPLSALGQIEGGIAQGLGLAVMEEIIIQDGKVRNPSFTDYLLPTTLDAPDVVAKMIEEYEPQAPLGAKGIGEPPCISVTPAIVAAIRNASAKDLHRIPVRPHDICL